jgi:hypothetical protein
MGLEFSPATEADAQAIREFVREHPDGRHEHTLEGVRVYDHETAGRWRSGVCVGRESGQLTCVTPYALARARPLPLAQARSASGPLVHREADPATAGRALQWLVEWARSKGCSRVELSLFYPEGDAAMLEAARGAGFEREAGPHFGTYWVPLGEDEAMLARMRSRTRRDARKGLREGIRVERRNTPEALSEFYAHYADLCRRKSIYAKREEAFTLGIRSCLEAGVAELFVASFEEETCAAALVAVAGRPVYWLGTTPPQATPSRVPPAGQVLHFEIMRHLAECGHAYYDLGGSPGPAPVEDHPNYSVWNFKYGFGGEYVRFLDGFYRVLAPVRDRALQTAYRTWRTLRR